MIRVYVYSGCDSCKKALKWLDAEGIEYDAIPIREIPPSVSELKQMLAYRQGELKSLFNTAGGDYRAMEMKTRLPHLSEEAALQLLSENGNLVKRPFLLGDDFGLVGFKPVDWAHSFSK